jgi:hypothetical protein
MNHHEQEVQEREFKTNMSLFFSFMLPLVGVVLLFVYWKKDHELGKRCFFAALGGLAMDIAFALIFRH